MYQGRKDVTGFRGFSNSTSKKSLNKLKAI